MTPSTQKQWTVNGHNGLESFKLNENAPVPQLGDKDVLVKLEAASINYRDILIVNGLYPFALRDGVVPGSDGAGTVVSTGKSVTRFQIGDKVATLFNQGHMAGSLDVNSSKTGTGGVIDGVLQQYAAFDEQGLVPIPKNLNMVEAATLSCAALTAWNALYGLESRALKPGDYVLTQGTGGVSLFALQFAKAAGAIVVATTSSNEKAQILKKLGADFVINYKEDDNWGQTARNYTPGGDGFGHVIDVGGPSTMKQSFNAIKIDGVISVIGLLGGAESEKQPNVLEVLLNICTVRGIYVGSRVQFEDMNRAIEANDIHPVVDEKQFRLTELKEAVQYMLDQEHFGKICIKID